MRVILLEEYPVQQSSVGPTPSRLGTQLPVGATQPELARDGPTLKLAVFTAPGATAFGPRVVKMPRENWVVGSNWLGVCGYRY